MVMLSGNDVGNPMTEEELSMWYRSPFKDLEFRILRLEEKCKRMDREHRDVIQDIITLMEKFEQIKKVLE